MAYDEDLADRIREVVGVTVVAGETPAGQETTNAGLACGQCTQHLAVAIPRPPRSLALWAEWP